MRKRSALLDDDGAGAHEHWCPRGIGVAGDDDVTPTGLETDLLAEMEIICFGDLFSDNTMTASRIEVVPEEVEDPAPTPEE